jgi:Ca2+-binding RTX toxin-like protein
LTTNATLEAAWTSLRGSAGSATRGEDAERQLLALAGWSGYDVERVIGIPQDDVMTGDGNDQAILGDDGQDSLDGGGGSDFISGQGGDDTITSRGRKISRTLLICAGTRRQARGPGSGCCRWRSGRRMRAVCGAGCVRAGAQPYLGPRPCRAASRRHDG